MPEIAAYAAPRAGAPLGPWKIQRREPGRSDVVIASLGRARTRSER